VRDPEAEPQTLIREETHGLWDLLRVQVFTFGGDVLLISRIEILSQLPELSEDNLNFDLEISGDFELQYILYHELPESTLWKMLIEMRE